MRRQKQICVLQCCKINQKYAQTNNLPTSAQRALKLGYTLLLACLALADRGVTLLRTHKISQFEDVAVWGWCDLTVCTRRGYQHQNICDVTHIYMTFGDIYTLS